MGDEHLDETTPSGGPSDALFRLVLSNVLDAVFITDDEGRFTFICPNVDVLFGYSEAEIAAMGTIDRLVGDRIVDPAALARAGTIANVERTIVDRRGETHDVLVTVRRVDIGGGTMLYACHDITDRKHAEHEAREREALLRTAFDLLPVGVWLTDASGRITSGNAEGQRIWGGARYVGPDEFREYKGWWVDSGRPIAAHEWAAARAVERGETSINEEIEIAAFDGVHRVILNSAAPIRNEDGRIVGAFIVNQDITDRKRASEALRESEEKYRLLFENMSEALVIDDAVLDADGRAVDWIVRDANPAYEEVFGARRDLVIGRRASEIYGPEFVARSPVLGSYMSVRDTGRPVRFETAIPQRGRFYLVSVFALPNDRFVTLTTDITERKVAEQAAERERAFCTSAIDILPFPIAFVGMDGQVLRYNRALADFFGTEDEQAWWAAPLLTMDTRVAIPLEQRPATRALHGEVTVASEYLVGLPDGREVPIIAHAAPICIDGEQVASVVVFQDIAPLKEADRAKDEFLAIVSHELLNPLTSILGWAQVAQGDPDLSAQALSIIVASANRQRRLVDDLLDVSRVVHRKILLRAERIDLWSLVNETAESVVPIVRERRLALVLEPPDGPLPIVADPARLRQVIHNLLTNAMKFTEPGGTITVRGRRAGRFAAVDVQDTGRGIAPEELRRLFRPFYQVERTRVAARGLGLGLALVRGIVEQSGGRVSASSPGLGQGSTFTVELPMCEG